MTKRNKRVSTILLLIECGYQDFKFTIEEIEYIQGLYGLESYIEALEIYENLSSPEVDKMIIDLLKSLSADELLDMRTGVNEIFLADGLFCRFEKKYYSYLNQLSLVLHSE